RDRVLARKVIAHDLEIDRLHKETIATLVRLTRENPTNAEALVHLVTMSKAIERVADHAKNIAESVVFLIEGVDIRHRKRAPEERRSSGRSLKRSGGDRYGRPRFSVAAR